MMTRYLCWRLMASLLSGQVNKKNEAKRESELEGSADIGQSLKRNVRNGLLNQGVEC